MKLAVPLFLVVFAVVLAVPLPAQQAARRRPRPPGPASR